MAKTRRSRRNKSSHRAGPTLQNNPISLPPAKEGSVPLSPTSSEGREAGWPASTVADWANNFLYTRQSSVTKRGKSRQRERSHDSPGRSISGNSPGKGGPPRPGSAPPSLSVSPSTSLSRSVQSYSDLIMSSRASACLDDCPFSPVWPSKRGQSQSKTKKIPGGNASPSHDSILSQVSPGSSPLFSDPPSFRLVNKVESLVRYFTDASEAASLAKAEAEHFLTAISNRTLTTKLKNCREGSQEVTACETGTQTLNRTTPTCSSRTSPGVTPPASSQPKSVQDSDLSTLSSLSTSPFSSATSSEHRQDPLNPPSVEARNARFQPYFSTFSSDPFHRQENRPDGEDFQMIDLSASRRPTAQNSDAMMMTSSPPLSPKAGFPHNRRGTAATVIGPSSAPNFNVETSSLPQYTGHCDADCMRKPHLEGFSSPREATSRGNTCQCRTDQRYCPLPGPMQNQACNDVSQWMPAPTCNFGLPGAGNGFNSGCQPHLGNQNSIDSFPATPPMAARNGPSLTSQHCLGHGCQTPVAPAAPDAFSASSSVPPFPNFCSNSRVLKPLFSMPLQYPAGSWVPPSVFVKFNQACADFVTGVYRAHEGMLNDQQVPSCSGSGTHSGCLATSSSPLGSLPSASSHSSGIPARGKDKTSGNNEGADNGFEFQNGFRSEFGGAVESDKMDTSSSM